MLYLLLELPEGDSGLCKITWQLTELNQGAMGSRPRWWDMGAVPARVSDAFFFNGGDGLWQ